MNVPSPDRDDSGETLFQPDEPVTQPETGGLDLSTLLATRLANGQTGEDMGLLSLLASQGTIGTATGSPDILQNLAVRMLEQHIAGSQTNQGDTDPTPEEIELESLEALERRREHLEQQRQKMANLKQVLTSLYAEVETLRARNDALAAALGACYLCFGDDPDCPECQGNGVPGSLPPDAATFRQYVSPALRRIRTAQTYRPNGESVSLRKEGNGHRDQTEDHPPVDPST